MAKSKRTNNDLQNIRQKTKDRTTRTQQKTGASEGLTVPVPHVTLVNKYYHPYIFRCEEFTLTVISRCVSSLVVMFHAIGMLYQLA